jgi:hypothetical protein
MKYHYTPIKMAKIIKTASNNWQEWGTAVSLVHHGRCKKNGTATLDNSLITSFTTNIATTMQLSNNPSGYL